MKNQLKLAFLLLALAIAAAPTLRAEDASAEKSDHKRGHRPGALMDHATKELGLSADQEAKWKAINQQEKAALDAVRGDTTLDKKAKRAKAKEINKGFADQRHALLTPDQAKKFDGMREKREEMREKRREKGEHGRRGEKDDPKGN